MKAPRSLEWLVDNHSGKRHHFDPIDAISHHVVLVVFLAMLFLFGIFMFLLAEPSTQGPVAYAIYEYKPLGVQEAVGDFIEKVRNSEERPFILLVLYTFWIIIFGLINMVIYERRMNK